MSHPSQHARKRRLADAEVKVTDITLLMSDVDGRTAPVH